MRRTAPYGTWESPVTLDRLVEDIVGLYFPMVTPSFVYWVEARPSEGGRHVIVRVPAAGGPPVDVLGPEHSARTTVHGYGGLSAAVHHDPARGDTLFFSNFSDQRLYRLEPGTAPVPITPAPAPEGSLRFAAPVVTPDGRHLLAVRERHAEPDLPSTVENDVVSIATDGSGDVQLLLSGHDFYSHVARSPDGRRLCWVSWDHPNMPWDGTELWEADLVAGGARVDHPRLVAGGNAESVTQPKYAPDGTLHYVSDRSGWWNLYAADPDRTDAGHGRAVAPMDAEIGLPDFVFGQSSYACRRDGSIVATWRRDGLSHLGVLRHGSDVFDPLDNAFTYVDQLCATAEGASVVAIAGSSTLPSSIVRLDPDAATGDAVTIIRRSRTDVVDEAYLSIPAPIDFPTEGGKSAHGLYYAPVNPGFEPPAGELPPLIVRVHGGPTSAAVPVLDYAIQFWTSRGIALVDVNYGGSTGYGREYRERLRGKWGLVDLQDCVNAARHLASTGRADGDRLLIHGGSAGGYTTLCAAAFTDVFAAGASYFGIADAAVLAEETHKFESRYMDSLFGPWPETEELYRDRSPAFHAESLHTPLIIFQGLEDKVVPPDQAEIIVAALRENGVPHAYITYEGEQHGFRKAESIRRTAEAELYFYGRVLGFSPADVLEPVEIVHSDRVVPRRS
ncbi:MAG TPA: prolyl oligopeptidase family serine peptidase [Acidimicrobiales bacterium]|nr:prolyl oligopeptidase family serine peptidase [Acidimicrobiales bacterium]